MIFSLILIIIPISIVGITSYIKSSDIVQKKVSQSNLNTVKQVGNNIELILDDVHDTSLHLIQDDELRSFLKMSSYTDTNDIQKSKIKIQQSLMYLMTSKKYINSVYIKGFNGITIDTKGIVNPFDYTLQDKLIDLKGKEIWMFDKLVQYDNTITNTFSLIRVFNDINNITNKLAILKINIDEKEISNIYKDKTMEKGGNFFIINNDKKVISSLDKNMIGKNIDGSLLKPLLYTKNDGYYEITIDKQEFLITFYTINKLNWKIINIVPLNEILKENTTIRDVTIAGILSSLIICLIFVLLFSAKVLSPLKEIRILMKDLENENFDVKIDVKGNDEIALLSKSFNKMSNRLNELMNQVYYVQIKQRESELKALQAQINPHFLYNSLDTIYWMSRMENAFETARLIKALSQLFRLSLNRGNEYTTVRNEIENINNYIVIQQARYQDLIDFSINVFEDALDCKVVKMVIQPLVENAIYHGIEKKGQKGKIDITVEKKFDKLVYIITDDGNGVNQDEINSILNNPEKGSKGFCIKNVNDRIKLYFGDQYGIKFYSKPGEGTKVVVLQPFIKGDE